MMMSNSRFTIEMAIRDNQSFSPPVRRSIGVDAAMRISPRLVGDLKAGPHLGVALVGFDDAVKVLKTKELRRDILKQLASQLAGQMADYLEDAEGWHDPERVEPARKALGGEW